jgi:hypothetical protein
VRVRPAEEIDRLRALAYTYEHARDEPPLAEHRAVLAQCHEVFDAARNVAEQGAGKVALGGGLEIVEPKDVGEAHHDKDGARAKRMDPVSIRSL